VTEVALTDNMRLTDSNHDLLMTNSERYLGRYIQNPEATKVSDEEVQEAHWSSVVGSKPEEVAKYAKVLETEQQMVMLIVTLTELAVI